jgi:hypothetical protein
VSHAPTDPDPLPAPVPGPSFSASGKPLSIAVLPEELGAKQANTAKSDENAGFDPRESLDQIKRRRERQRADRELQDANHDGDLHGIRKAHARYLLGITVTWLLLVWFVILLNGFGQWFLVWCVPDGLKGEHYLPFKLSDTVMVAFITSTTATVLGLYGIAAYWLYGKKPGADDRHDKKPKDKKATETTGEGGVDID